MNQHKENYICAVPFTSLEVHDNSDVLCCGTWLTKWLPDNTSPKESWNSKEANDIRESILDGSYKYCDSLHCPYLKELDEFGTATIRGPQNPLYRKDQLPGKIKDLIKRYKEGTLKPTVIQFSFDRTCNLKCPSCRVAIFTASSKKIAEVQATIDEIEEQFGSSAETLYITGSGDPFISVGFRNFLRNFDKKKWPNIKNIHLHTNATKWNKKMWNSMKNIHHLVRTCEISIDAATKETYENQVRLGGDWDELIANLKFIATIPEIKRIKPSFVIQRKNYKEIKPFYDLMTDIFGNKASVYYGKITNWGTFTEEQFRNEQVWNPEHPDHLEFKKCIEETFPASGAWTNAYEFIPRKQSLV